MTNNIRVAINAYAGGVLLGVGTLLLMFHNGMFALGGPLQVCYLYGETGDRLLQFILPHGPIELTTIFIAGGAGMMVGHALLFPGDLPRWSAVRAKAWESLVLIMGCFPLLVLAVFRPQPPDGAWRCSPAWVANCRWAVVACPFKVYTYSALQKRHKCVK